MGYVLQHEAKTVKHSVFEKENLDFFTANRAFFLRYQEQVEHRCYRLGPESRPPGPRSRYSDKKDDRHATMHQTMGAKKERRNSVIKMLLLLTKIRVAEADDGAPLSKM
ncbi:hypothetical protein NPIL_303521 [Nephila pilipes]|uniref:Uncharacterized protein n=1 Tax=Nephila pilipes TaxID=299642 RepID=A0A8X6QNX5_NEPPI|nr:hypothetical protein NPIL_303521 [Nephila pilipes]